MSPFPRHPAPIAFLLLAACGNRAAAGETTTPSTAPSVQTISTTPSSGGAAPEGSDGAADPNADGAAPGANADPNAVPVTMVTAAAAARATPISVGDTVRGALEASDIALQDGSVGDDYVLDLTAGNPVTIVTRGGPSVTTPGDTMDVYTLLIFDGHEVTHDDDSAAQGTALNSRITYTPRQSGRYTIRVSTFGAGLKEGAYELQIYAGALPNQL